MNNNIHSTSLIAGVYIFATLCIAYQVNAEPVTAKTNQYLDQLHQVMGPPPTTDSYCMRDRPYDMGMSCQASNVGSFMAAAEKYLRGETTLVDESSCVPSSDDRSTYVDFVVVGSGAAGSVVARRLAEQRYVVLLLEAGGPAPIGTQIPGTYFQYLGNPQIDWNFPLEKEDNACLSYGGVCHYPRGKVMGGTTQLHGMMYMRGYPQDFNDFNLTGWTWDDVMPYYLKSEDNTQIGTHADPGYHATGGLLTVSRFPDHPNISIDIMKAAHELGYEVDQDLNGKSRVGFTLAQATVRNGERLSVARAFLYDALPRLPNYLKVRPNSQVTKILFDDNKNAIGVEYIKNGIQYTVRARKEVIISAGAIQSPQLLMLSGIGPKDHLQSFGLDIVKDLPGVGQNLQNHGSFSVIFKVKNDKGENQMNIDTLQQFIQNRTGPLTSTGMSQLTGFLYSQFANPSTDAADMQMFFAGYLANCSADGQPDSLTIPNYPQRLISMTPTLLRPKSIGYIQLRSPNPFAYPKIFAHLLNDPEDVTVILDGVRLAQKLAKTNALKDLIEQDDTPVQACIDRGLEYDSDHYWDCAIRHLTNPENHQVGTCKMGVDGDAMAVTDEECRVRGVKNLRVVDASIFPAVPSGNLNAPTIMVGEKCSDAIIKSWDNNFYGKGNGLFDKLK
ncbi:glucose dehydrogenase [FAD, quinone]-like [Chrysoperla carnea]|uniref:glucose dehydrogenase [FAD, quinone]-like n=1 Tax=Chrysoperla carnea TaxID=189513 RepID=UPI001D0927FC|nr:glucose dehydrogenase [FAD, quinone]-like [Chrysoperla carnea]